MNGVSMESVANILGILERNPPPPKSGLAALDMTPQEVREAAVRMGMAAQPGTSEVRSLSNAAPEGLRRHSILLDLPPEFWGFIDIEREVGGWSRSRYITEFMNTWWRARKQEDQKLDNNYLTTQYT